MSLRHPDYRRIFIIRFLGYFLIFVGLGTIVLIAEPVFNDEFQYRVDKLLNNRHEIPRIITSAGEQEIPTTQSTSSLGNLVFNRVDNIAPVDTDFGIVIEKLNANARVISDVDPTNELEYVAALGKGVAHAKGTNYPGEKGNIYLFSHSIDAPWNVVRFNAVFYLLNKMESGDRIIMFYKGRRYDYIVYDKSIVPPEDTSYLTNVYDQSVLTLQTCDPPGTLSNRLIVRARLQGGN